MTRYLKSHNHPHEAQSISNNLDKHVHKTHNNADQVNEVTCQTQKLKGPNSETEDTVDHHDPDSPYSNNIPVQFKGNYFM